MQSGPSKRASTLSHYLLVAFSILDEEAIFGSVSKAKQRVVFHVEYKQV